MKYICLCFLILIQVENLKSQVSGSITGIVTVVANKTLEGTIVSLQKAKDGTILKTQLLEQDGKFEFHNLFLDSFTILISNLNYKKFNSTSIYLSTSQPAFYTSYVLTQAQQTQNETVLIIGKVPFIEKKIDRIIVNPDALISNAGTNALEVLEKSPGILVDMNGNISIRGKQGVVVYIDDRPGYLNASDLANYLKSLPASSLALIEIMTNPPAKYDAAGNAGIINIKLKKSKTKGINAGINTNFGLGTYARSNNSVNFNYRINKLNFFTNIGYTITNSYQDLTINRTYYKPTGALNSLFNQNSYIKKENTGATAKLGFDFYATKKSTFGIVYTGFNNNNKTITTNTATVFDSTSKVQNYVNALTPSVRQLKNNSINLNYTYAINKKGGELSVNTDYIQYNAVMDQSLESKSFSPAGNLLATSNLISNLPATINIKTAKFDYSTPLKNAAKLEAGLKTSFIQTNNIANFFDEVNNILTPNYDFSNNFKYKENINAAYVNYNFEHKKFAMQTGLRFENTTINGNQTGNPVRPDSNFTRKYNSLFPTFFLSYKLDTVGKNQLGFSFGRRIDRPDYQALNPFTYPLDRFTLYGGNPYLQPTFSNNFELSHTYKNKITTTLQYSITKDVINETIEQRSNIFYSRPGNFGKQISYSISVNAALQPTKWWTVQLYTEVTHNIFTANLYQQQLNNRGTFWYFGPNNTFQLSKKWSAELSGNYQTGIVVGQFLTIPVWSMRAGFAKKIFKDMGGLKFNINDMFYTNQPGGDIKAIANSNASWFSYLDTRVVSIALGYRFNKGKGAKARNSDAADAEKSRVK